MYSSQFDGNTAFSGGGFMPSQATQTNEFGVSPAKNRDSQGLFPLTVKQINDAYLSSEDKANFVVDGVDINNVTLVGRVINKLERVTEVTFTLDDGTGRVDCHRWMNESIDTREMEEIQEGMYARIYGNLKGFQGKKHLVAFSVRPVIDFNDIAYHFVDCMSVHVSNTRLQKVQGNAQTHPQVTHSTVTNGSMGYQAAAPNQFPGQFSFDGIKGIDQKVLDYLQQPSNLGKEKGVHRDELVQHLKIPLEKIMESIRSLEEEGAIYSTIDDCHYKSTVNG